MVSLAQSPVARDVRALLGPLAGLGRGLACTTVGEFLCAGRRHEVPRLRFTGPDAGHEPIRLGFFAGVHGDEPAGCTALIEFVLGLLREPGRAAGYDLWIYPVVNPTGYERGTRENHAGKDLNREFWLNSPEPEVRLIEAELQAHAFAGIATLHADDTCEGLYGYTHGRTLEEALLKPVLCAAERVLPRDRRELIDGFVARDGLICDCFRGVLSPPLGQKPRPFDVIFETPAHAPFTQQVSASVMALDTILAEYRGWVAHAQGI